jgi:hypothetical protein
MHAEAGYWIVSGKPLWQTYLACYGVSTVEIFGIYFGFFVVRNLIKLVSNWRKKVLRKGMRVTFGQKQILILQQKTGYQALNHFANKKKQGFTAWLGRRSIRTILIVFCIPVLDIVAIPVLASKNLNYGYWYLAAANLLRIFILIIVMTGTINFTINCFFS